MGIFLSDPLLSIPACDSREAMANREFASLSFSLVRFAANAAALRPASSAVSVANVRELERPRTALGRFFSRKDGDSMMVVP